MLDASCSGLLEGSWKAKKVPGTLGNIERACAGTAGMIYYIK
jgi:hypothetical protein